MKVGTVAALIKQEKKMALAQNIIQGLAKENLTIIEARTILELAQHLIDTTYLSVLSLQNTAEYHLRTDEEN